MNADTKAALVLVGVFLIWKRFGQDLPPISKLWKRSGMLIALYFIVGTMILWRYFEPKTDRAKLEVIGASFAWNIY